MGEFKAQDESDFEIILEVFVEIEGREGVERFDVTVCTRQWILNYLKESSVLMGHGLLIITEYSYLKIVEKIESHIKMCGDNNIDDVIRQCGPNHLETRWHWHPDLHGKLQRQRKSQSN